MIDFAPRRAPLGKCLAYTQTYYEIVKWDEIEVVCTWAIDLLNIRSGLEGSTRRTTIALSLRESRNL